MAEQLFIFTVVGVFGSLLCLFLCMYALFTFKSAPGGRYYIFATLMCAIFSFSYVLELNSTTLEAMKLWLKVEYLALPFIPVFILLMCVEYVGRKPPPILLFFLYFIPQLTIFFHFTNDLHHYYYTSVTVSTDGPFPLLVLEGGLWFYVHSIFLYVCIAASLCILLIHMKKVRFRFKMQIFLMVIGLIVPIIGSMFYLTGTSPYGIDTGPISMSVAFLFHGAAILSLQMFNVAPIARETIFENMQEGVIVVNQQNRIIDYNHAMKRIIPSLGNHVLGRSIAEVLQQQPELKNILMSYKDSDYHMEKIETTRHYDIRFTPVYRNRKSFVGRVISFVDVTERVKLEEQLTLLASMDGLTQILNRTFFMKKAEQIITSIKEQEGTISFIMFDIDHFKMVNDTYGHEAGDKVLVEVIHAAKTCLRDTDIIGRYGGEEFIICLPNTSVLDASLIANDIRTLVYEAIITVDSDDIRVTSSFGITTESFSFDQPPLLLTTLIQQADKALYEAKHHGRNCIQLYSSEPVQEEFIVNER
ncbi:histidine kinase N-terminal 7TM domain-containing protein [Alkalihalobacillus sp. LMS39]|uniref:histidine kinase N-terminal 7TM domain-containing diguanylate cyclase n=1 Tax=Alkalihalobacillus sp. LMS39 TaxID=2924032 RepID=UPI001FB31804|nr:histidine kinase N-terminal 7TM domain-containing protein [Alkalihalobacillus sp. LMS39]UOE92128.1 diguanylate cyclase [Alkalihalobacillus sp. LMS39]